MPAFILLTLALLAAPMTAQVYLVSGTPTPHQEEGFNFTLFRVEADGTIKPTFEILPGKPGAGWIAVSHQLQKAVIVEKYIKNRMRIRVLNLDKPSIAKTCETQPVVGGWPILQWVATGPGARQRLAWYSFPDVPKAQLLEMDLDATMPCAESFRKVSPNDARDIVAEGTAGIGDFQTEDGLTVGIDQSGKITTFLAGVSVPFDCEPIPAAMRTFGDLSRIQINNPQVMLIQTVGMRGKSPRFLAFRKKDRVWRVIPAGGDDSTIVRGFGRYVSIVEARAKEAVAQQLKSASRTVHINEAVRSKEQSPGHAQWRRKPSRLGPDLEASFSESIAVFPGRLHVYDLDSEHLFTIETKQGDSEILLIEDGVIYYRVNDQLFSASISDEGVGTSRRMATDDVIRDAHWAFIQH